MPPCGRLYLLPPSHAEFRKRPNLDKFHLEDYLLEVCVSVRSGSQPGIESKSQTVGELLFSMDRVTRQAGGNTMLKISSYTTYTHMADDDEGYEGRDYEAITFVIQEESYDEHGNIIADRKIKLTLNELMEFMIEPGRNWIAAVGSVLSRNTDFTYKFVDDRIEWNFGEEAAVDADNRYVQLWHIKAPRTAKAILNERLPRLLGEPDKVKLPCGHVITAPTAAIEKADIDQCISVQCSIEGCGKRILQPYDIVETCLRYERQERKDAEHLDGDWINLDLSDVVGKTTRFPILYLAEALEQPLTSLTPPSTILPRELAFARALETALAYRALCKWAQDTGSTIKIKTGKLHHGLRRVALEALILPRGTVRKCYCRDARGRLEVRRSHRLAQVPEDLVSEGAQFLDHA
jgi:hypothetical protein